MFPNPSEQHPSGEKVVHACFLSRPSFLCPLLAPQEGTNDAAILKAWLFLFSHTRGRPHIFTNEAFFLLIYFIPVTARRRQRQLETFPGTKLVRWTSTLRLLSRGAMTCTHACIYTLHDCSFFVAASLVLFPKARTFDLPRKASEVLRFRRPGYYGKIALYLVGFYCALAIKPFQELGFPKAFLDWLQLGVAVGGLTGKRACYASRQISHT